MDTKDTRLVAIHAAAADAKSGDMRRASVVALAGVLVLITIKAVAWWMTGSLSLLSSLVDSGMDMLASLTNFFAIRYALVPPDAEHRFGHGKVEYIAGMGQAVFIATTAVLVGVEAVSRLITPQPVEQGVVGIGVMAVSIVVTLAMVAYQKRVVARTGSVAVEADSVHYTMDVLSNIAVIVALGLTMIFGWHWADPLFALGIAVYILHGAWGVGHGAFQNLMDREFTEEERHAIAAAVLAHPEVQGMHALKTRRSGLLSFIQLHIEVDGQLTLEDAHTITEEVEQAVEALHPHAEVLIHAEPV